MSNKQVTYFMEKSPLYKNVHVDGVFGGITPKGLINISFYLERGAIPKKIINSITEKNTIGSEISREGKEGIIREIECGVILDINTAKLINKWLSDKIKEHKKIFSKKKENHKGGEK